MSESPNTSTRNLTPADSWYYLTKDSAWNCCNDMVKGYKITDKQFEEFSARISDLFTEYDLDREDVEDFSAWDAQGIHVVEALHEEFPWLHDDTILLEWRTTTLRKYVNCRYWDMRNLTGMGRQSHVPRHLSDSEGEAKGG